MGQIIALNDEQGREVHFEFIDYINYEDKTYIVLIEEDPAADEVTILEVEDGAEEEEENYLDVEDADILQAVFEIFKANLDAGEYSEIFE